MSNAPNLDIRTVGDMGQLPDSLPVSLLPDVPLNLHTLGIIFLSLRGHAARGRLDVIHDNCVHLG